MSWWDLGGLTLLGVFHGLNPAMGWLFAVAIGFRERSRRALGGALVPLAVGHLTSMALTILLVEQLRVFASDGTVRVAGALGLLAFAASQVARSHPHPRWVGMNLRPRELALWSFLMSTAHGAGLMLIPVVMTTNISAHGDMLMPSSLGLMTVAVAIHTAAMIAVAGTVAFAVYEFIGVGVLRRGWLNFDRLWIYALGAGAAATLIVA